MVSHFSLMRAIWDLVDGGQLILHRGVRIVDRLLLLNPHIRLLNRLFNLVHIWGALVFILDLSFRKCLFALNLQELLSQAGVLLFCHLCGEHWFRGLYRLLQGLRRSRTRTLSALQTKTYGD